MIPAHFVRRFGLSAVLIALLLVGCRNEAEISVYEIPKETKEAKTADVPQRMLAAMVRNGGKTWFVKLTGAESLVTPEIENFVKLVRGLEFESSTSPPKWKLPEGWKDADKRDQVRFATLEKSTADGKLEITFTSLPTPADWNAYVVQNVNRWRGQLGLAPLSGDELGKQVIEMPLESDPKRVAMMVNIAGRGSGSMSAAQSTPRQRPSGGAAASASSPRSGQSGSGQLAFDLPAGWKQADNDTFSVYAFLIEGEDAAARVTITPLAASDDPTRMLANVNRWRGQVNLPPWTLEQSKKEVKEIPFMGGKAKLIEALPAGGSGLMGIIGVIGNQGNIAWFIKFKGDAELLKQKQDEFEQFVRSIRSAN